MGVRGRLLSSLSGLILGGCSSAVDWVAPPSSTAPTAIISHGRGQNIEVFAVDLVQGTPLFLEEVSSDAVIEAALFSDALEVVGLRPGPVMSGNVARPLLPSDGIEFLRLAHQIDEPRWSRTDALSSPFAEFRLPVQRPDDLCPSFDQMELLLDEPGQIYFGTPGEAGHLLIGGQDVLVNEENRFLLGDPRLFDVALDGTARTILNPAGRVIATALTKEGEGFWGTFGGEVYAGGVRDGSLELQPLGSTLLNRVLELAGSATSSTGLFALVAEQPEPDSRPPLVYRFDGLDWELVFEAPFGSTASLAYADGEAVFVSEGSRQATHIRGTSVRQRPLPDIGTLVAHVPGLGFVAGERGAIMRYAERDGRWEVLSSPAPGTTRLRGITPFRAGFVAIYETAIAYYSPALGEFCPPIDIPWSDLTWARVMGEDLFVYPRSDRESNSMRIYILRYQGGG